MPLLPLASDSRLSRKRRGRVPGHPTVPLPVVGRSGLISSASSVAVKIEAVAIEVFHRELT